MTPTATQTRANGTNSAPQRPSTPANGQGIVTLKQAVEEFKTGLVARVDEYAPSLPTHITPERFQRVVVTAVNLNPKLLKADRRSLYNSCARAASDGLLPDGREGALVIFNTKVKDPETGRESYQDMVTWMPMIAGIMKKARQSGEISVLGASIVYENEIKQGKFVHRKVNGIPTVDHEPILWGDRGAPMLVYAYVQFKDGTQDFEPLHKDDIAKIRAVSRAKNGGPWNDWTEEMWKKSAIRRLAKRLPISSELFDTIARDDELTEFEKQRGEAENKMLATARAQLGAAPSLIDGESEVVEAEETGEGVQADEAARSAVEDGEWVD